MDAIHRFGAESGGVVLRLTTNANITGWGYISFGFETGGPRVVEDILQGMLKQALIGQDPTLSKKLRKEMWRAAEYSGTSGLVTCAMAAVDMAFWDIVGKAGKDAGLSFAGWLPHQLADLRHVRLVLRQRRRSFAVQKQIQGALEEGFQAVKIKVGRYSLDDDVKRIRAAQALLARNVG